MKIKTTIKAGHSTEDILSDLFPKELHEELFGMGEEQGGGSYRA